MKLQWWKKRGYEDTHSGESATALEHAKQRVALAESLAGQVRSLSTALVNQRVENHLILRMNMHVTREGK